MRWHEYVRSTAKTIAEAYGFAHIATPVLEDAELFSRGLGAATDIVEKELFTLKTKGGDFLALRPEGTAPIARAYIQQGMKSLPQPVKLFYYNPMFRHDRPQRGRLREFWQFGLESIGEDDPVAEAELIQIFFIIFRELGLKDFTLQLNSVGCSQCRPYYKKVLAGFYRSRQDRICATCKRRMRENILRVLDCKEERCQEIREGAPQFVDHLCDACTKHFKRVLEFLEELGLPYLVNFYLVRGLDYYTKTVFEFWPEESSAEESSKEDGVGDQEDAAEDEESQPSAPLALAAGGRYDDLLKRLGGKPTPAVGVAGGVERITEELRRVGDVLPKQPGPEVFLVQLGELAKKNSLKLFEELRLAGIVVQASFGKDSIRSQLRIADKLVVPLALILGQKEAVEESIIIREMETGTQETVPFSSLLPKLKERLRKMHSQKRTS